METKHTPGCWEPIETAPKDGRYLIVGRFGPLGDLGWVRHSRWQTAVDFAEQFGGVADEYLSAWTDGLDEDEPCHPTHWIPLPAPPRIDEAIAKARGGE